MTEALPPSPKILSKLNGRKRLQTQTGMPEQRC